MGLFAVARLAERHRVRVRLRPAPPQGLSALVWLPDSVIERTNRLGQGTSSWSTQPVGARTRVLAGESAALAPAGQPSLGNGYSSGGSGYSNGGNGYSNGGAQGNPALEGRTASGWFRGGQDGTGRPAAGTLGGQDVGFAPDWGPGTDPAATFSEPSHTDQTASGLPVRVPRANMPPGASGGGGGPSDGQAGPPRAAGSGTAAGKGLGSANSGHTLPRRSPDQARSRLSGFQRGTRRAEGQGGSGGQAPRAGEGTLS
jgi:hypothetical protein